MTNKHSQAIIILHEIYGINQFIIDICQKFKTAGFDIYCPNLIHRAPFDYEDANEAYSNFMTNVGFDTYKQIIEYVKQLKNDYEKVYILGFSVGATLAFRCSESPSCDGIIACYGSRIRDYADLTLSCPTLLLFANELSFDITTLISHFEGTPNVQFHHFNASHAFLDPYSKSYDPQAAKQAELLIIEFLNNHNNETI